MSRYYSRAGEPLNHDEFLALLENEDWTNYKRVSSTYVGDYWVSTVWLGLNHSFDDGDPLIFETMVFKRTGTGEDDIDFSDLYVERYSNETDALAGHLHVVLELENDAEAFLTGESVV